ncbi:MAG: T9SS type A sorting domain-containing protein [Bacteroidales bacterium]|nr:T9SS type A sorting domain-containing protein [Bacteroidales bacterium]
MKKISLLILALVASFGLHAQVQTLAFYSFNQLDSAPNTQTLIMSDGGLQMGTATMYLDGTNGSSSWTAATELNSFAGSAVNALENVPYGRDLALRNSTANGKSVVFNLSTTGFQGMVLSYAFRRTGTGFNSCVWEYSTDGTNYTVATTKTYNTTVSPHQLETVDMSGVTALNDKENVYLRLTVDGCSSGSGNVRLDNVKFTANPEGPDVYAPYILNATATSSNTVNIDFNEELDNTSATNTANYVFEGGYTVSSATLNFNVVTLTVSPAFANGVPFTFSVQNVEDVAGNVMEGSESFTLTYGILDEFVCENIAVLRSKVDFTSNAGNIRDSVEYKLASNVIVVATDPYNNQKVLQDETGAILVYDQNGVLGSLDLGDEISGVYCTLTNYYGFLELVPTRPYEQLVDYLQNVDPMVITLEQLNDNDFMIQHQAELIKLENVTITSTGAFAIKSRYDLQQGSVTAPALFPYFRSADYISQNIPTGVSQDITGFNFSTTTISGSGSGEGSGLPYRYYIVPRFSADMTGMTGVQDYGKMKIAVYPNPTTAFVTVNDIEATDVEIYDINGKKVASQSMQNTNMVSLQSMSAGSYFLRLLKDGELVGTAKVVKR